ncbi:CD1871A family CXXC motif-containing protein [Lachnospiraceae bacterium 46-61]
MNKYIEKINIIRFAVLAVCIIFIAIGLLKHEQIEVFTKAVKICLECIGIA